MQLMLLSHLRLKIQIQKRYACSILDILKHRFIPFALEPSYAPRMKGAIPKRVLGSLHHLSSPSPCVFLHLQRRSTTLCTRPLLSSHKPSVSRLACVRLYSSKAPAPEPPKPSESPSEGGGVMKKLGKDKDLSWEDQKEMLRSIAPYIWPEDR
jgi:hypothetical protein